jgi:amino acid permease
VWISILFVVIAVLNLVAVNYFGESEVFFGVIKVLAFIGASPVFISMLLVS